MAILILPSPSGSPVVTSRLAVVVVNYKSAPLAVNCLRSLLPEIARVPGTRVVLVDNASGDGSVEQLSAAIEAEGWGTWASLIVAPNNRGFSAGNNIALRKLLLEPAPADWYLLLNPDTVVHPGALEALLECTKKGQRVGIVGACLENLDGTPQNSAFRFPSVASEFDRGLRLGMVSRLLARWAVVVPQPSAACLVDWVSGACLLVRREVLDTVGLLDEMFFLYYEEVDLCWRASRHGWECWHEPESRVVHLFGQSTGLDPSDQVRRLPPFVFESRHRFFVKNFGFCRALLADFAWLSGHLGWRIRMRLLGRPVRVAPNLVQDFVRHSTMVRRKPP